MAAMTAPLTATAAGLVPSGSTARRDRTTRSYAMGLPPAEARRAVRRVRRLVLAADPAGVPLRRELAEQRLIIQLACPGRAAVRDVGDRHVTPGEVQQGELHPGVRERPGEGVDFTVARHRVGERPPELHRVEPGGPGGLGPLQQRELGEQDRAVDVEPQSLYAHSGQSLMALTASRRCSVRATRQPAVYCRKLRLRFRITDEFGARSPSERRRIVSACLRKGL